MSSTGRKEDREASDNYPTPSWCVRRLLDALTLPTEGYWAEPCVGEGAIVRAVAERHPDVRWVTQDIRKVAPQPEARSHVTGDFCGATYLGELSDAFKDDEVQVCLTNPPFSLARKFIESSKLAMPQAIRIFLLRLNFLGSEDRRDWLAADMPAQIWQLPNRPSFVKGKTDSIEYGWFVWYPGTPVRETTLRLLPLTSLEERKRG